MLTYQASIFASAGQIQMGTDWLATIFFIDWAVKMVDKLTFLSVIVLAYRRVKQGELLCKYSH